MKRLSIFIMVLAATAMLTACGDKADPSNGGADKPEPISGSENILVISRYEVLADSNRLEMDHNGLRINTFNVNNPEHLRRSLSMSIQDPSDFVLEKNFIVGRKNTSKSISDADLNGKTCSGQLEIDDIVYLGGKKAGLEYSDFGLWLQSFSVSGTVDGKSGESFGWQQYNSFETGMNEYRSSLAWPPQAPASFTGSAIGELIDYSDEQNPKTTLLKGEVRLNVIMGENSVPNIIARFDYDNGLSIIVTPQSLKFTSANSFVSAQGNYTVSDSVDVKQDGVLKAYFYGPAGSGAPNEVSGTFHTNEYTGCRFTSVFGVKRSTTP